MEKLAPSGEWNPIAFVDAWEQAAKPSVTEPKRQQLRDIQALEFDVWLADFCQRS